MPRDLDTFLQLLIENTAFYLEIEEGFLQYLEGFRTSFLALLCGEKKLNSVSDISDCYPANPTLCASKPTNPERKREKQEGCVRGAWPWGGGGSETNHSKTV